MWIQCVLRRQPWDLLEKSDVPLKSMGEMLEGDDLIFQLLSFKMSLGDTALVYFFHPGALQLQQSWTELSLEYLITHVSVTVTKTLCSVSLLFMAPPWCLISAEEDISALCPFVMLFKVELPAHSLPEIPAEFNGCCFPSWCRILGICGSAHPPGARGCACPGTHTPAPLFWLGSLGPTASFWLVGL